MDNKRNTEGIDSKIKKATEEIINSYKKTKESLHQIKAETKADVAKKETILSQFIEESDKFKSKKDKQLDLMNERLNSFSKENTPDEFFAELDNLTTLMNSYYDEEVIQAVKDKQLKDARID